MRWLGLVVLAACADEGAQLTFDAPEGLAADRVEIVLASANPETIATARQRARPGALTMEDVVYYRQRATGGVVESVRSVDGFQMRIEPEPSAAPDEMFIPFALLYASDELVGVGAVVDDAGAPMPVEIREGELRAYTVQVTPTELPGEAASLVANQGLVVRCADRTSGAAWRPASGPQLRLLLGTESSDASERTADLDCDDFAAADRSDGDCDDLRLAFHPGQMETCDGLDTDCDGRRMEVQPCALPVAACGGTGVSLCVEDGASASVCQPGPACACANGIGTACAHCEFDTRGTTTRTACAPAVGKLHIEELCQQSCEVEVVAVEGDISVGVAALETGAFGSRMQSTGTVYLRVTVETPLTAPILANHTSVAQVFLAITTAGRTHPYNVDMWIGADEDNTCVPGNATPNEFTMSCAP